MSFNKLGKIKLSKSKKAVIIYLDGQEPIMTSVSGLTDLLAGRKQFIDVSRPVKDAQESCQN
jgi:hypothetical protein